MRQSIVAIFGILFQAAIGSSALAAYPGVCTLVTYKKTPGITLNYNTVPSASLANDGTMTWGSPTTSLWGTNVNRIDFIVWWKETPTGTWNAKGANYNYFPNSYTPNQANFKEVNSTSLSAADVNALYPQCVGQCAGQQGQAADPVLVGLPYNADYYGTVGICSNNCQIKPTGGVVLSQYANDGSGWTVGPWGYTGQECTPGVTPAKPNQPSPEEQCENQRDACQAQCDGRAFEHNCTTGTCECFGSPGYNADPPKDPTTPTGDPGSPSVPNPQTPTGDPGVGGNQLGAQISNQAKQIAQGDAQLGQLGGINSKLGAVISNQAKQLGQGDTMIDYERRQLAELKEIKDELKDQNNPDNPGVPGNLTLDAGVGDAKDWTEHDDPVQVGQDRANQVLQSTPDAPDLPMNLNLQLSGAPALSGTMFGKTVEIRFDRPWMQTGYSVMAALLVGIGYLQVFLMINRTITGDR